MNFYIKSKSSNKLWLTSPMFWEFLAFWIPTFCWHCLTVKGRWWRRKMKWGSSPECCRTKQSFDKTFIKLLLQKVTLDFEIIPKRGDGKLGHKGQWACWGLATSKRVLEVIPDPGEVVWQDGGEAYLLSAGWMDCREQQLDSSNDKWRLMCVGEQAQLLVHCCRMNLQKEASTECSEAGKPW